MDIFRFSSFLLILSAINLFYTIYGYVIEDYVSVLISVTNYLLLIYTSTTLDRIHIDSTKTEEPEVES